MCKVNQWVWEQLLLVDSYNLENLFRDSVPWSSNHSNALKRRIGLHFLITISLCVWQVCDVWIYGFSFARLASILEVPLRRIRQRVQGHFPSEFSMLQQKHMPDMCLLPWASVSARYCFAQTWKTISVLLGLSVSARGTGVHFPPWFSNVFLAFSFHLNEAVWKRVSRLVGLQLLLSWAGPIYAIGFAGHIHRISQMRTMTETSR